MASSEFDNKNTFPDPFGLYGSPAEKSKDPVEQPRTQKPASLGLDPNSFDARFSGGQNQKTTPDSTKVPEQKTSIDMPKTSIEVSNRDWDDAVNTIIAEAAGEGFDGMSAVAHVVNNRARQSGKSIGDVVRAPKQFSGYEQPGQKALMAMKDPQIRAQAEAALASAMGGSIEDFTKGADHYHADSVSPNWAQKMPSTGRVGGHTFYADKPVPTEPDQAPFKEVMPELSQEPEQRRGLARLVPEEKENKSGGGTLKFVNKGQDRIAPHFHDILTSTSQDLGRGLTITSGFRSVNHPVEARKAKGGEHTKGTAVDISMAGMNEQERTNLVSLLRSKGVNRFGIYKGSPNMLHVDMKDQTGKGTAWFMYDRSNGNMKRAPRWFQAAENLLQNAPVQRSEPTRVSKDYVGQDPFGLYPQDPKPVKADPDPSAPVAEQPDALAVKRQIDPVEQELNRLNTEDPDRYASMTQEEYDEFKKGFDADQPYFVTDLARMVTGGAVKGVGSIIQGIGRMDGAFNAHVLNPLLGTEYSEGNHLSVPAEWVKKWGEGIQEGISQETKDALEGFNMSGDILKMSTWNFGDNPSVRGVLAATFDVFGGLAPIVLAGAVTGGAGAVISGGMQSAGGAEDRAYEVIDAMAAQEGVLEKQSALFREQIAAGVSREKAIENTKNAGANLSALYAAPVGGAGGFLTAKLASPATKIFTDRGVTAAIAGRTAVSAVEEGSQEVLESVAANAGINQATGTDIDLTEDTFADFVLGALAGGGMGAAGGGIAAMRGRGEGTSTEQATTSPEQAEPVIAEAGDAPVQEEVPPYEVVSPRSGSIADSVSKAARHTQLEYIVNDPAIGDVGAGELHGAKILISGNQDNVPAGMVRIITPVGTERTIGSRLLMPLEEAGDIAPPQENGETTNKAPENAPALGADVIVNVDGVPEFKARIDGYYDGDAMVIDSDSGEVLQVPMSSVRADGSIQSTETLKEGAPVDINEAPVMEPIVEPVRSEGLPKDETLSPIAEEKQIIKAGTNVIVDDPNVGKFSSRIQAVSDDGTVQEVVVKDPQGNDIQVPVQNVKVSSQSREEIDREELKRNPPVQRDKPDMSNPLHRELAGGGRVIALPDSTHAALYDLGRERFQTKQLSGASTLDMDGANVTNEYAALARKLKISPVSLGRLADDYRYKVERMARDRASNRSNLPINMYSINSKILKGMQDAHLKETGNVEISSGETLTPTVAHWFDEMSQAQRKELLNKAGVKRSEKFSWADHNKNIQGKLEKASASLNEAAVLPAADNAAGSVDVAAKAAALSPENSLPEPTQAQKEAGNYAKGHVSIGGLNLAIENPAGSERKGTDKDGKEWSVTMKNHYGYIKGTIGKDKDHIDVFVKSGTDSLSDNSPVFVVDQKDTKNGAFDEHKVMVGFDTLAEARDAYHANYEKGWNGLQSITETSLGNFKTWLKDGDTTATFAPKWFGSQAKADAYIDKNGLNKSHTVQKNGKRFEIRANTEIADLVDKTVDEPAKQADLVDSGHEQVDKTAKNEPVKSDPVDKTSDNSDPVAHDDKQPNAPERRFADNKVFTADKVAAARARLKSKLSQLNTGIDPEVMMDGIVITGAYIESGMRDFTKYSKAMIDDFGDKIKPYLLSFWEGARHFPNVDNEGMTSPKKAKALHTDLLAGKVMPADLKSKPKSKGTGRDYKLENDFGVENIDGYSDSPMREIGNNVKDAYLKNAKKYFDETAKILAGHGYEPFTDKKGKSERPVSVNEAGQAVSGEVSLLLHNPYYGTTIYAQVSGSRIPTAPKTKSGVNLMLRTGKTDKRYAIGEPNQWINVDLTAGDLADLMLKQLNRFTDSSQAERAANEPSKLGRDGTEPLERAPAEAIQELEGSGDAGTGAARGRGTDGSVDRSAAIVGSDVRGSLADGQRGLSDPASGKRSDSDKPTETNDRRALERGKGQDNGADLAEASRLTLADGERVSNPTSPAVPAHDLANDFSITDADEIGAGGAKTKFRNNIAAIKLLRKLDVEKRQATRSEQQILAKWVGWGGLQTAFHREDGSTANGWQAEADALKKLLTPEEYRAAQASTRNAHFTAPEVVKAIWDATERMGFKGGRVLEPSVGAGNFLGLVPDGLRHSSHFTGVELDHITGGIAKHLYPRANIQAPIGFQDVSIPNGHFDLAIGNPPFGSERLYDKNRRELKNMSIHNFFFAKSVDALKPNGVLAMVITNAFMDAPISNARDYIAQKADLIGAIRLPNDAFLKNAGTAVTTDIVFIRKRAEGEAPSGVEWANVSNYTDKEGRPTPLNEYFIKNPEMMLGDFGRYGSMYAADQPALISRKGDSLDSLLQSAIERLPEKIMHDNVLEVEPETIKVADNIEDVTVGSMFLNSDGNVLIRAQDVIGEARAITPEFKTEKAKERAAGMIRIRDAFTKLRRAQVSETATEKQIENLRNQLNKHYDAFVAKHGQINLQANRLVFSDDPTWPQLSALEDRFDKGVSKAISAKTGEKERAPSAKKSPIFSTRTQYPYVKPTKADSAKDALSIVMSDRGRIDMAEMVALTGKTEKQLEQELGSLVYKTPEGEWQTADLYLSGNVRKKLAQAEDAAKSDSAYKRNVDALRDVIPADIEAVDIRVKFGSPWVPSKHVASFVDYISGTAGSRATFSAANSRWALEGARAKPEAETQWATGRTSVRELLGAAVNGSTVTVYDRQPDGKSTVNNTDTEAANAKVEAIKTEWDRWIWQDDARRDELARIYNDTYNSSVRTIYDGSHLRLPNKVGDDVISLRPHQKSFVWRVLQSSTALADHTVGAGKTFAAIAAVMELRRTGLANKPMMVVPNHLVGQWAADFTKLYPNAKVLAATKKDFEKNNRKRLFARVATGDWDAVIVAHSSFGRIGVDPVFEAAFINQQMEDIEAAIADLRSADGKDARNVKQLSKWRESMQTKLEKLMDSGSKDEGLTFEEMGVDGIFVDEAHEFKNLAFATSMNRVAGLGNPIGSQKAADLFMKIQSVKQRTGGRNIVFLTGTPISNTMAEMYTMQRYMDYSGLQEKGIAHFDSWARVFGEVVTDWELSPAGQYKLKSRFSKFVNIPELVQQYTSFADVITNEDIQRQLAEIGKKLPLPRVKGGKPQNIVVKPSDDQIDYIGEVITDKDGNTSFPVGTLVFRSEHLPKKVEKGADNMLKIMSDARKAALDMRLINPALPDVEGSKVHIAADNMVRLYKQWHEKKGTQLVFIDLSTPKGAVSKEKAALEELVRKAEAGDEAAQEKLDNMSPDELLSLDSQFSVYDDLKQKLIDRGVPENEIAFIHSANTDAQKEELFSKVRAGTIRFMFGSTPKMGAGTNVQNRLVGLHHLDAPWRPSDLEQRDGRGIRQGNELYNEDPDGFEIEILRYATERTLDARQWQTIEQKARFIQQIRKGDSKTREIEDIGGEASNAAEMKAAASGNPLILEEMELRQQLRKLDNAATEHDRTQFRVRSRIRQSTSELADLEASIPVMERSAKEAADYLEKGFHATIAGKAVEKPSELGEELIKTARAMLTTDVSQEKIGSMGVYKLTLDHLHSAKFALVLDGVQKHEVVIDDIDVASPTGLGQRAVNTIRRLLDAPDMARERVKELEKQVPALEKQLGDWPDLDKLRSVKLRHEEVLGELRPKSNTPTPEVGKSDAKQSVNNEDGEKADIRFSRAHARLNESTAAVTRAASNFSEARIAAKAFQGKVLTNKESGLEAVVSRNNLDKMLSTKAVSKSDSPATQSLAVANLDQLYARAIHGWSKPDDKGDPNIVAMHRLFSPLVRDGKALIVKLTVKETAQQDRNNPLYTIEAVELNEISPAAQWVGEIAKADGIDPRTIRSAGDVLNIAQQVENFNDKATNQSSGVQKSQNSLYDALKKSQLGSLVDRLMDNGRLTIVPESEAPAPNVQAWTDKDGRIHLVDGVVGADSAVAVLLHEAFHTVEPLIGTKAWDKLTGRLNGIYNQSAKSSGKARQFFDQAHDRLKTAKEQSRSMDENLSVEEFAAYAIEEWASAPPVIAQWAHDVLGAVKAWVLKRFGAQIGEVTPAQLKAIAQQALVDNVELSPLPPKNTRKASTERKESILGKSKERLQGMKPAEILSVMRGASIDAQPALLKAVHLNYFEELAQPNMTGVSMYMRVKRSLDSYRGKKHAKAAETAQEWLKYTRLGKQKAADLADLMHRSTLAKIDPSSDAPENVQKTGYAALKRDFQALPKEGQALFTRVRDDYLAQAEEMDNILMDNVQKAYKVAEYRADKAFRKEMERLAKQKMNPVERREAEEEAVKKHKAETARAKMSMKARLTKLRLSLETNRIEGVYFPLSRSGQYFVTVRDSAGEVVSFSRVEKARDRERLATELKKEFPNHTIEVGVMERSEGMRQAMDPRMVAEMEGVFAEAGLPAELRNDILDQLWQRYLETLPDLSMRKRFIHRKGTAGYSADALKSYSSHMFHAAHQMGKLRYGIELKELLNITLDQAKEAKDPTKGMMLANEMKSRHEWVMNPKGSKWAQYATSAAFVWYLSATPAAALVNLSQTPMLGIPILGARYGGVHKAAAALTKASYDILVKGRGRANKVQSLTEGEKNALAAFYESGLIDRTQSHDLAGVGETGVEYSPVRAKVMEKISWMFHNTEVLNREVTALAAFRMAKEKGMRDDAAIDAAHDLTWKIHFDYSNSSRPALMQGDTAKVLFVFRSYNANMLYRIIRDTHQSFKGETPQARKEARAQLTGILGVMGLLAGGTGVFGYNALMALLGAIFDDDDEPYTFEERFRKDLIDTLGTNLGGIVLNGLVGHVAGINLTSRIGMADMWFRSPSRELNARQEVQNFLIDGLGAVASMGGDTYIGANQILKGEIYRGIETMSPKVIKDMMKAYRYMNEGVVGAGGNEVLPADAMNGWDAVAQAMGFSPAKVAETWSRNASLQNAEKRGSDRRKELLNRLALAYKMEDREAQEAVLQRIETFNAAPANRSIIITNKTINQSMKARARNSARREDGVLIQNKQLGHDLRLGLPDLIYR